MRARLSFAFAFWLIAASLPLTVSAQSAPALFAWDTAVHHQGIHERLVGVILDDNHFITDNLRHHNNSRQPGTWEIRDKYHCIELLKIVVNSIRFSSG